MVTIAIKCRSKLSLVSRSDDLIIGLKRIYVQPTVGGEVFQILSVRLPWYDFLFEGNKGASTVLH